jgi:large subunit ribosomal protein L10
MKRNEKSNLVSLLNGLLKGASGVFVVENHGLTVKETEELRRELKGLVSLFKVVKNRLFRFALKETEFEPVSDFMKKPTAVAIATDALAVAKVLAKFADAHPNLALVGGKMDADLISADGIVQLSKLPSLLEIRARVARILIEPGSRLARVSAEYGKKS